MKTIVDLENMKLQSCPPFVSVYEYFIESLSHHYTSKHDGKERIRNELNGWDKEAQLYIVDILIKRQDMMDLNKNDFLESEK